MSSPRSVTSIPLYTLLKTFSSKDFGFLKILFLRERFVFFPNFVCKIYSIKVVQYRLRYTNIYFFDGQGGFEVIF